MLIAFLRLGFGLLRARRFRLVFLSSAPRVARPMPKLGSRHSKLAAFNMDPRKLPAEFGPSIPRSGGRGGHPRSHSGVPKGGASLFRDCDFG